MATLHEHSRCTPAGSLVMPHRLWDDRFPTELSWCFRELLQGTRIQFHNCFLTARALTNVTGFAGAPDSKHPEHNSLMPGFVRHSHSRLVATWRERLGDAARATLEYTVSIQDYGFSRMCLASTWGCSLKGVHVAHAV